MNNKIKNYEDRNKCKKIRIKMISYLEYVLFHASLRYLSRSIVSSFNRGTASSLHYQL